MKSHRASHPKSSEPLAALLSPCNPGDLRWEMQQVQLAVLRRAYELFEARGCEHGHDWEDWFRAESELLRPVSIVTSETDDQIRIRANVLGFEKDELKVSIEPRRITILGKKGMSATETEGGKVEYIDWSPDQILRLIDLATEVTPESAVIELQAGLLKFELHKAAERKAEAKAAAA